MSPNKLTPSTPTTTSTSRFRSTWSYKVDDKRMELDLLRTTKAPQVTPIKKSDAFDRIPPRIRRLITLFDSLCPNVYRLHCSDSLRILKEIICLTDEYLHVIPSLAVSTEELIDHERYFEDFLSKIRLRSIYHAKGAPFSETKLRCFGQGIQTCNYYNTLHQTLLFCFELNVAPNVAIHQSSMPFDLQITDPSGHSIPTDIRYIHCYNHGQTHLFSCSYTPNSRSGIYKVSFQSKEIPLHPVIYSIVIRETIAKTLPTYSSSSPSRYLANPRSDGPIKQKQQGKRLNFLVNDDENRQSNGL